MIVYVLSFLYPTVFWFGLPVIALPVIIHLLNLRRRRRVPWAAMKFLLESQQQSKTWISLRELLLLLLRTAAIALLVVMLARPSTRSGWIGRLLNRPVHHLVLLDDSYSMTDRWAETTAWDEGLGAVGDIVRAATDQSTASVVSVLRFSEAQRQSDDPRPAIFRHALDDESRAQLTSRIETAQPGELAPGLLAALRRASELADLQPSDQDLVVHVVSDFRQRDLAELDAIESVVKELTASAASLQFVRCARQAHDNLAITLLEPEAGVRAADVEMWMRLAVRNYGSKTASNVVVELQQDDSPLIAVPLGTIAAGEQIEQRFRVTFAGEGPHWLEGTIDADAVALDNRRLYATELPKAQRVLLVDGSPSTWESYYLSTAIAPGGLTKSGWESRIVRPAEFSSAGSLDDYAAVAILDVPRLSEENWKRLEEYVERGGGLLITMGESIDRGFYAKEGFNAGAGLCPAPPTLPTQWIRPREGEGGPTSDLRVTDHPLFRIFRGERNSMLALMKVNYYYALAPGWKAEASTDTRVIASLAGGAPLVIEKQFGKGKVILQLTKASPDRGTLGSWSNWGPNPAFVVLANELFAYLANGQAVDQVHEVGDTLRLPLSRKNYAASGNLRRMGEGMPYQASLTSDPNAEQLTLVSPRIERHGLYELQLNRAGGGTERRFAAVNTATGEGDLALFADATIRQKFVTQDVALRYADELASEANPSESAWTELLLAALVLALVAEQGLAYYCSFHE